MHRPAIAVLVPLPGRPVLLLDAGANVDVRPEHLVQFAYMGAAFMEAVHGVARPRVGLLSIGEEAKKGTDDVVAAHERLAAGTLDFAGNVEGTDLAAGAVDVVVTDGFTGNVALKLMEGTAKTVAGAVRDAIRSGPVSSLGGLLVRGRLARRCASSSTRTRRAARSCSECGGPSSSRTGNRAPRGSRTRSGWRAARPTRTWSSGPPPRLPRGGALRSAPAASVGSSHD